jgi:DNA-binding CsgD family transcriptional regulator
MLQSITALMSCHEPEAITGQFGRIIGAQGFSSFSYVDLRRIPSETDPVPFFVTTVRADFIESYNAEMYLSADPVLRRAWNSTSPFSWFQCGEFRTARQQQAGRKSKARQILELAHDHGFEDGVIVPVHSVSPAGNRISSFISLYADDTADLLARVDHELRLACAVFHEQMTRFRDLPEEAMDEGPVLSDRERECLLWTARGKSAGDIATILGLSDKSVASYLRDVMKKLGVYRQAHAVAVAIRDGHIVP